VTFLVAFVLLLAPAAEKVFAEAVPLPEESIEEMIEAMSPGAKTLHLSLEDCIASALENNLDIKVERYAPEISDAELKAEQGIFDPHLFFNATYVDGEFPLPVRVSVETGGLTAIEAEKWFLTGGITGVVPTGLIYELILESEETPSSTITEFFDTNGEQRLTASLNLVQPLMKNFGKDITTTGIRVAVKNKEAALHQLEQRILEIVFEVEQAYWELVFAYEDLRVKSQSLRLAQNLLEENEVRLRVGVVPSLAVLQSEAGVVFREEELIVARSAVEDARDRLIRAANLFPEKVLWNVQVVSSDKPGAEPSEYYPEDIQIEMALGNRPELKQLLSQHKAAELGAEFARNQLLPTLDLNASVGLVGLDNDFGTTFLDPSPDTGFDPAADDLSSGENFRWMAGLKFEFPWGNHAARGEYTSANLLVSQLDTGILSLRQVIIQDIRNALRGVETNRKRVELTKKTVEFRRESLSAERKKYDVGVSTAHDLLEFEEELAEARAAEQRALVDYALARTNLMRANATLLKVRNVHMTAIP